MKKIAHLKSISAGLLIAVMLSTVLGCDVDNALTGSYGSDVIELALDITSPTASDKVTWWNQKSFPVTGTCQKDNARILVSANGAISDEVICSGSSFTATLDFELVAIADGMVTITAKYSGSGAVEAAQEQVTLLKQTLPFVFVEADSEVEGNPLVMTVTLDHPETSPVVFSWSSFDDVALLSDSDYSAVTNQFVTLPANVTVTAITLPVNVDILYEADETVMISLTSTSNSYVGTGSVRSTIVNNDPAPSIFVADSSASEGGTLNAVVSLSAVSGIDTTFQYWSFDQTAISASDYTNLLGLTTIPSGQSAITLASAITTDDIRESSETFLLSLTSVVNANVASPGADDVATLTVLNTTPLPEIFVVDDSRPESQDLLFAISLSRLNTSEVTLSVQTFDQTATVAGLDYTAQSRSLTIAPMSYRLTLSVPVTSDSTLESDETFLVSLSSVVEATVASVGSDDLATGTIQNDDAFPMLYVADATVSEGSTASLLISLSEVSGAGVVFDWQTSDNTAIQPGDYTRRTAVRVTIPAGMLTASSIGTSDILIDALSDGVDEEAEDYQVALTPVFGASTIGGDWAAVVSVTDQDPAPLLFISDISLTEPETQSFVVSLGAASAKQVSFNIVTVDTGSATPSVDFVELGPGLSATIAAGNTSVTIASAIALDDVLSEGSEDFQISLSGLSNAGSGDLVSDVNITDDDGVLQLFAVDESRNEGNISYIAVTLSGLSGSDVTFNVQTYDGSATEADGDYAEISRGFTIPAGGRAITISNGPDTDTVFENNETYTISLSAVVGAVAGDFLASVELINDDPEPGLFIADQMFAEDTTGAFVVSLSSSSGVDSVFSWQTYDIASQAQVGIDYTASSGVATVPIGQVAITVVSVAALPADIVDEPSETFLVSLTAVSSVTLVDGEAIGTITDNDGAPDLFVTDLAITEGATGSLLITLNASSGVDVEFQVRTYDSAAVAPSDYTSLVSSVITIPAGQLTAPLVNVSTVDDSSFELSEVFQVSLFGVSNAGLAKALGSVTILNDESPPSIYVGNATVSEGETLLFEVSLSGDTDLSAEFDYTDFKLSMADFRSDYSGGSGRATIPVGSSAITIGVESLEDITYEADELFAISLQNLVNAEASVLGADDVGNGVILNDDPVPTVSIFGLASPADEGDSGGLDAYVLTSLTTYSEVDLEFRVILFDDDNLPATEGAVFPLDYSIVGVTTSNQTVTVAAGTGFGTYPAGPTQKTDFDIKTDALDEDSEWFTVSLSAVTNVGSVTVVSAVEINDQTPSPNLFVSDLSLTEGQTGFVTASLSSLSGRDVTFSFQSFDGTAGGLDYLVIPTTSQTILAGQLTILLEVATTEDLIVEGDETFSLSLTSPANANLVDDTSVVTIVDDDSSSLFVADAGAAAEGGTLEFLVSLSAPLVSDVSFTWQTFEDQAVESHPTDVDGDFIPVGATSLTIAAGDLAVTLSVETLADDFIEGPEGFGVTLSGLLGGAVFSNSSGRATITSSDAVGPPIMIAAVRGANVIMVYDSLADPPKKVDVNSLLPSGTNIVSGYCDGAYLVAGEDGDLIRSVDGVNWSSVDTRSFNNGIDDLVQIECLGDRFLLVNGSGFGQVVYSDDAGLNWSEASGESGLINTSSLEIYRGKVYWWSRGDNLYVSTDEGENFTFLNSFSPASSVNYWQGVFGDNDRLVGVSDYPGTVSIVSSTDEMITFDSFTTTLTTNPLRVKIYDDRLVLFRAAADSRPVVFSDDFSSFTVANGTNGLPYTNGVFVNGEIWMNYGNARIGISDDRLDSVKTLIQHSNEFGHSAILAYGGASIDPGAISFATVSMVGLSEVVEANLVTRSGMSQY
ncbi:MAG: hypothetical protein HRT45_17580, partial [Bdellovibrionales bacterium]|nr:hypothetical protein [Bdellovibrionales bacterium]